MPERFVGHDENDGGTIKLKCDYSSLAEMFGRSRDPITNGEHGGRGGEGRAVYGERQSPDDVEEETEKKRGTRPRSRLA